jgi:hypothetical protein
MRPQAVDFDPDSLRKIMPAAVKIVANAMDDGKKCVACACLPLQVLHVLAQLANRPQRRNLQRCLESGLSQCIRRTPISPVGCARCRVYVHCTAGLGRAPAVCIAYLYWWCGMSLDDAYKYLTDIRPCGPKVGSASPGY